MTSVPGPSTPSSAAVEVLRLGRLFLVRRRPGQTQADIDNILRRLESEHRAVGKQLFYVALVRPERQLPDQVERAAIEAATPKILEFCESISVVIEGHGILVGLMRAVVRTMMVMASRYEKVRIHASLAEALASLGPSTDVPPEAVLRAAREAGLID